jgi:N-methylhydantoinase A/oxoprolinase/acetone carboxylase beta subunit
MPDGELRLGVDAGQTSADAVLVDRNDRLLAKIRLTPPPDVGEAIGSVIHRALASSGVDPARVTRAMLGASHAMSTVLERRAINRVAVVRIGRPLTGALPPLCTWPADLRRTVSAGECVVRGGAEYDGRPAAPVDEEALVRFLDSVAGEAGAVAIAGVFSPVTPDQELAAAELVRKELGDGVSVSLSHEIGSLGLLGRENATVLNAALIGAAEELGAALRATLDAERVDAEPFFAQNDGSVMAMEHALRYPVLMIGSRAATGMRGAAYLSGVGDAVVVSVGAVSTVVGVLVNGYPRESDVPPSIEGVRMDFRAPSVLTLPFGVETAPGRASFKAALRDAVEHTKGAHAALPLVAVGEGSALVPDALPGVSEVMRPADGELASAVGIAIAPVSGQADVICSDRPDRRVRALEAARSAAIERAIHAGADPRLVEVVEVEELPLTYLLDPAVRIRVKAAGPRV